MFVQRCVSSSLLGAGSSRLSTCLLWSGEWGVSLVTSTMQLVLTPPTSPPPSNPPWLPPPSLYLSSPPSLPTRPLPHLPHHSRSWVNLYCVLNKGEIGFYKDAKNTSASYNNEPQLNLGHCHCDVTNGYKKKKNVFTLKWGPASCSHLLSPVNLKISFSAFRCCQSLTIFMNLKKLLRLPDLFNLLSL